MNRRNIAMLRTFGDIVFTCLILFGLFGPQDPGRNISLFLAWGIWWAGVVLSWFYVGKLWCGVCPFPGIGRLLQRFGLSLNLDPPHTLRKYFIHIAVVLFAIIIWAESVTDMKNWPLGTALLLLSILLGATIMGALYKGQAWCRYVCPLGKIIGAGATMSMIELRSNPAKCRTCRSYSCKKGKDGIRGCPVYLGAHNVQHNLDCLLCGRCVSLCDRESPRLYLRNPFVELVMNKGRHLTCTFIIPFLMGSQWARFMQEGSWYPALERAAFNSTGVAFTLLLALGFCAFLLIIRLGDRLFGIIRSDPLGRFSPMIPVLVPLAFSGELIYRIEYLLSEAGNFPAVFGRQFGLDLERFSFVFPAFAITGLSLYMLLLGALGSLYVTALFRRREFRDVLDTTAFRGLQALVVFVALVFAVLIL